MLSSDKRNIVLQEKCDEIMMGIDDQRTDLKMEEKKATSSREDFCGLLNGNWQTGRAEAKGVRFVL